MLANGAAGRGEAEGTKGDLLGRPFELALNPSRSKLCFVTLIIIFGFPPIGGGQGGQETGFCFLARQVNDGSWQLFLLLRKVRWGRLRCCLHVACYMGRAIYNIHFTLVSSPPLILSFLLLLLQCAVVVVVHSTLYIQMT